MNNSFYCFFNTLKVINCLIYRQKIVLKFILSYIVYVGVPFFIVKYEFLKFYDIFITFIYSSSII